MADSTRYEHLDRLRRAELGEWQPAAEALDEWRHRTAGITSSTHDLGLLLDLLADAGYIVITPKQWADVADQTVPGAAVTSDRFATAVRSLVLADQRDEPVSLTANQAAAVLTVLTSASEALNRLSKAALVVKGTLTEPYPDAPTTSPWVKFVEAPSRRAYNLGNAIRRVVRMAKEADGA